MNELTAGYLLVAFFSFGLGVLFMGVLATRLHFDLKKLIYKYNILLIDYELLKRKGDQTPKTTTKSEDKK